MIIPAVYLRLSSCHHHLHHLSLVLMSLLFSCQCVTLPDVFSPSFSLSVSPSLKIVLCNVLQKSLQNFNESHHLSASVSFSSLQEKTMFRRKKRGGLHTVLITIGDMMTDPDSAIVGTHI